MKIGPCLLITIGAAIGLAFTRNLLHLLTLSIIMGAWLTVGVPIGMAALKYIKANQPKPKRQLTELEQLWLEVGPPEKKQWPPEH